MGDDGWLKRCRAEYRRFFFLSEALWISGTVKNKYLDEDGEACVDIETSAINQRGEEIMPGDATVVLPSQEKKTRPLEGRH
jgi:hypothetical protein